MEGLRDLQIPSGTQPGETLKFANMGIPDYKRPSVRGDHHFLIKVEIPKNIRLESFLLFTTTAICLLLIQIYLDNSTLLIVRNFARIHGIKFIDDMLFA